MERRANVRVSAQAVGSDWLFTVTGGKAHIGAIATAGEGKHGYFKQSTELPGHKEGPLAEQLAELAASALHATVTVIAGIHIPEATKAEILQAVSDAEEEFKKTLNALKHSM